MYKIKLLNIESNTVLNIPSISTITIYQGKCPKKYILERLNDIINLNPWLNGNLIKADDKIYLQYKVFSKNYFSDDNFNKLFGIYRYLEDEDEVWKMFINDNNTKNYNNLINHVSKYLVNTGNKCIKNFDKLFKVILIDLKNDNYSLIISLNHCIGDGYTYYKIYSMFSNTTEPESLIILRKYEFDDVIMKNKSNWQSDIGKKIYNFINLFFKRKSETIELLVIDKNKIELIKKDYQNKNIIVSINDIITSEFFNKANTIIGLMNFNYRNTDINKYKLLAGNYIDTIYFYNNRNILFNPIYIRFKLNKFRFNANIEFKKKNTTIIGNFINNFIYYLKNIFNIRNIFSLSCISSWHSLYRELVLHESSKIIHIPCLTNLNSSIYLNKFCVVFHYSNDKIGILSNTSKLKF